ncbi:MAG: type II toxin-antitoxin system RelE/ParE family toxin [Candidatus Nanopelagicales bacterium]
MTQYSIHWTPTGTRSLQKIPEKVATAAVEFLYESVANSPARVGKPLRYELEGLHVARRGSYRIIYAIDHAESTVTVLAIRHRADAYRT